MSSDKGPGTPSFGDLFDDPDAPDTPAAPVTSGAGLVAGFEDDRPETAQDTADDRDHESAEGAHLVAGFEPTDDVDDTDDERSTGEQPPLEAESAHLVAGFESTDTYTDEQPTDDEADGPADEAAPSPYDSAMIAPLGAAMAAAAEPTPAASSSVIVASSAPVTVAPAPWDGTVDRSASSAPATRVDTGRLYRSSGAEGPATLDAIPALDPGYSPARRVEAVNEPTVRGTSGLTYTGVAVVVASTVLAAIVEVLLRKEIGAITGLALLVSSVYSAVVVRRVDMWAAVVMPPLAFLAAAFLAGQLTLATSGSLLIREGFGLFRNLAVNAPWILGTTLVCLVIVLLRRRRD